MNEELDKLRDLAIEVENACYYPERKIKDGSPYTYRPIAFKLTDLAIPLLGGVKKVDQMTLERKKQEPLADPNCGNWTLWTILNAMGVSREKT